MASGKIFINYRRDDSRADSGRLYDRLKARYPNHVFRDIGSLEPGVEWQEAIEKVLGSSDAVVVVIGKSWLTVTNSAGTRRLDDPKDTVRQEILTALRRGVRVFPVLVGGARMPSEEELPADLQSLARRNALEITEQDWDEGFEKLAEALDHALGVRGRTPKQRRRFRPGVAAVALLGATIIAAVVVTIYHSAQNSPVSVVREDAGPQKDAMPNAADRAPTNGAGAESNAGIRSLKTSVAPPREQASRTSSGPTKASAPARITSAPVSPPPAEISSAHFVGNWRAIVTGSGQQLIESVDLYPDFSFGVTLNRSSAAVGGWQYNAADDVLNFSNGTNFLNNGVKFACKLKGTDGTHANFGGPCLDLMQMSWNVALTREGNLSEVVYNVPKVDLSALTMAEKAAFTEALSQGFCTCGCGMTILNCLRNDRTCLVSPNLARAELVVLMQYRRR
jgi:hypothetical protein